MTTNKFPSDDLEDFDAIRKAISDMQAVVQSRPPLTAASKGWKLGTEPPDPSELDGDEVWIGSQSGRMVAMDSSGATTVLEPVPEIPQAADVGGMDGLSTPNAWPSTYDPTYGERVQDDLEMIRVWVLQLRTNLRDAGLMA